MLKNCSVCVLNFAKINKEMKQKFAFSIFRINERSICETNHIVPMYNPYSIHIYNIITLYANVRYTSKYNDIGVGNGYNHVYFII